MMSTSSHRVNIGQPWAYHLGQTELQTPRRLYSNAPAFRPHWNHETKSCRERVNSFWKVKWCELNWNDAFSIWCPFNKNPSRLGSSSYLDFFFTFFFSCKNHQKPTHQTLQKPGVSNFELSQIPVLTSVADAVAHQVHHRVVAQREGQASGAHGRRSQDRGHHLGDLRPDLWKWLGVPHGSSMGPMGVTP